MPVMRAVLDNGRSEVEMCNRAIVMAVPSIQIVSRCQRVTVAAPALAFLRQCNFYRQQRLHTRRSGEDPAQYAGTVGDAVPGNAGGVRNLGRTFLQFQP